MPREIKSNTEKKTICNAFIKPSNSTDSKISTLEIEPGNIQSPDLLRTKPSGTLNNMKENKLEIEHGEYEDYMSPTSATSMGSRPPPLKHSAHGNTSASSRMNFRETWSSIAPSLKVLSPDEIQDQEMQDLEIEDFGSASGSDLTDDSDDNDEVDEEEIAQYLNTLQLPDTANGELSRNPSALFKVVEPGKLDKESTVASSQWEQESLVNTARQLSLLENEPDSELDSDEENAIMKEIKNDITQKVREEMKHELAVMKRHIQEDSGANKPIGNDDLENLEPDLKAALLKVRKLDRILAKKITREHEVKRERILLERRLKKELEEIKPEGRDEIKEVQVNTSKFLALTLPPRHNAGITVRDDGEIEEEISPRVTPLFTTQVPEYLDAKPNETTQSATDEEVSRSSSRATNATSSTSQASATTAQSKAGRKGTRHKKKKDFIKRNVELAADAANPIAMTEEEKQRVGDLLVDIDNIPESFVEEHPSGTVIHEPSNPFQITLSTGDGFHPALDERKRLEAIDKRLQRLLPKSDYDSIATTPISRGESQQSLLFTRSRPLANYDIDQLGERALRETKEERDLFQRLKDIEFELNYISDRHEHESEPPTLSKETLDHLLDDCARSMPFAEYYQPETPEPDDPTSRSATSVASRASLLSNPPHLSHDVLQELLADARRSICGSATSQHLQNGHNQGDLELESASQTPTNALCPEDRSSRASSQTSQSQGPIRNQSQDSLNSQNGVSLSNTNHGQETVLTSNSRPTTADSWSSSRPNSSSSIIERKPFLPEIDPKGRMSTQRQGSALEMSESFINSGKPMLAKAVWSSFSDDANSQVGTSSDSELRSNNTTPIPHPPTSGRRSKNQIIHRTDSPS